nr:immunoglobulin heavy chain junction region [Macaca mulatta]MOW99414.1 immunoglobulin heavy chain junction region [Macaca mulatta]MOW99539.1 immunoglobulin heavy chain junction region [Macaca mulatta]MOX00802.1 immunoglobulin heavy chain junction region [Macaca mulatta]MOX01076.1 immunoglobulin heavy chain junction region [Macaca mulatta]
CTTFVTYYYGADYSSYFDYW